MNKKKTDIQKQILITLAMLIKASQDVRVYLVTKSLFFFCAYYFRIILWPHQVIWATRILKSKRHLTLAPAGHGKTELKSFLIVVWKICQNRNLRFLIVSASADLAVKNCMRIREELETNTRLIRDFGAFYSPDPRVVKVWQQTKFQVIRSKKMKDPTVQAIGILGKITGSRYDYMIFDDVIDAINAATIEQRKKIKRFIYTTLLPRLEPWGYAWAIGTRKHSGDIYGDMLKKKIWSYTLDKALIREPQHPDGSTGWRIVELEKPEYDDEGNEIWVKVIIDSVDKGQSICPELWSVEALILHRYLIGTIAFNQEYQNTMTDDMTALFKRNWLDNCVNETRSYYSIDYSHPEMNKPLPDTIKCKYKAIFIGIDPSLVTSEKAAQEQESSYMVQIAVGLTTNNKREVLAIDRFRGLSPKLKMQRVKTFIRTIVPDYTFMEKNSFGTVYISMLVEDDHNLKIIPHHTGKNKNDLYAGVPSMSVLFENQSVDLPYKTESDKAITDEFIEEFHSLGTSEQTDQIMALWIANTGIERWLTGQARLQRNRNKVRGE